MLTWSVLDWFFDCASMADDIVKRPFITLGMTTFLLLLPLRRLRRQLAGSGDLAGEWKQLHRLVYLAGVRRPSSTSGGWSRQTWRAAAVGGGLERASGFGMVDTAGAILVVLTRAPSSRGKSRPSEALKIPADPALLRALLLDTLTGATLPGIRRVIAVTPASACDEVREIVSDAIGPSTSSPGRYM